MNLEIAGCASTYHKNHGKWPENFEQVRGSCEPAELRIIREVQDDQKLAIVTEPLVDGVRIIVTGQYRGDFKNTREYHFSGDSMTVVKK